VLDKYKIIDWKSLLNFYLHKKNNEKGRKYLEFMMSNKPQTIQCAKDVYKLRTEGMETLLDPKEFETFYQ